MVDKLSCSLEGGELRQQFKEGSRSGSLPSLIGFWRRNNKQFGIANSLGDIQVIAQYSQTEFNMSFLWLIPRSSSQNESNLLSLNQLINGFNNILLLE